MGKHKQTVVVMNAMPIMPRIFVMIGRAIPPFPGSIGVGLGLSEIAQSHDYKS
jgi:hypothetical protein